MFAVRRVGLRASARRCRRTFSVQSQSTVIVNENDPAADPARLKALLLARSPRLSHDYLSPMHAHQLRLALGQHSEPTILPAAFHHAYFPLLLPPQDLLSDGTDPLPAPPGSLFPRRVWAGASVERRRAMALDGRRWSCVERVVDAGVRRGPSKQDEKIVVELQRRYAATTTTTNPQQEIAAVEGDPALDERRTLVFLRLPDGETETEIKPPRIVQPPADPDYAYRVVPSAALLFHFSALSYNAHAIHLDRQHACVVEGLPGRLVHGPLTEVLLLGGVTSYSREEVLHYRYRNVAPLYENESLRVCAKRKRRDHHPEETTTTHWDVWIEGPRGLAVRGDVTTLKR